MIQREIQDALAMKLLDGTYRDGDAIRVSVGKDEDFVFESVSAARLRIFFDLGDRSAPSSVAQPAATFAGGAPLLPPPVGVSGLLMRNTTRRFRDRHASVSSSVLRGKFLLSP